MAQKPTQLDSYKRMRRRRVRIITLAICGLFALAVLIGAVSYYGSHVGNFVIGVEKDSRAGLALSETYEFLEPKDVLSPKGVKNQTNTSLFYLPLEDLNSNQGGLHSDFAYHEYFAYTFYLKNVSKNGQIVDYDINLSLRTTSRDVDEAIRIMLVRNRDIHNEKDNRWIFAKADRDSETGKRITQGGVNTTTNYAGESYNSTIFESASRIGTIPIKALPPDEVTTYTVILWLEGDDPDCVDAIRGGTIMLDMEFNIVNIHEA